MSIDTFTNNKDIQNSANEGLSDAERLKKKIDIVDINDEGQIDAMLEDISGKVYVVEVHANWWDMYKKVWNKESWHLYKLSTSSNAKKKNIGIMRVNTEDEAIKALREKQWKEFRNEEKSLPTMLLIQNGEVKFNKPWKQEKSSLLAKINHLEINHKQDGAVVAQNQAPQRPEPATKLPLAEIQKISLTEAGKLRQLEAEQANLMAKLERSQLSEEIDVSEQLEAMMKMLEDLQAQINEIRSWWTMAASSVDDTALDNTADADWANTTTAAPENTTTVWTQLQNVWVAQEEAEALDGGWTRPLKNPTFQDDKGNTISASWDGDRLILEVDGWVSGNMPFQAKDLAVLKSWKELTIHHKSMRRSFTFVLESGSLVVSSKADLTPAEIAAADLAETKKRIEDDEMWPNKDLTDPEVKTLVNSIGWLDRTIYGVDRVIPNDWKLDHEYFMKWFGMKKDERMDDALRISVPKNLKIRDNHIWFNLNDAILWKTQKVWFHRPSMDDGREILDYMNYKYTLDDNWILKLTIEPSEAFQKYYKNKSKKRSGWWWIPRPDPKPGPAPAPKPDEGDIVDILEEGEKIPTLIQVNGKQVNFMHMTLPARYGMVKAKLELDEDQIVKNKDGKVIQFAVTIFDATWTWIPFKIKIPWTSYWDEVTNLNVQDVESNRYPYIHKSEGISDRDLVLRREVFDDELVYFRDEPTEAEKDEYYKVKEEEPRVNEQERLQKIEDKEAKAEGVRTFAENIILPDGTEITENVKYVPKLLGYFDERLDVFKKWDEFKLHIKRIWNIYLTDPYLTISTKELVQMLDGTLEFPIQLGNNIAYLKAKVENWILSFYWEKELTASNGTVIQSVDPEDTETETEETETEDTEAEDTEAEETDNSSLENDPADLEAREAFKWYNDNLPFDPADNVDNYMWVTWEYLEDRGDHDHAWIDISMIPNTPIKAVMGWTLVQWPIRETGYGTYVKVIHDNGYETRYGHLSEGSLISKIKDADWDPSNWIQVEAWDTIWWSGNTGTVRWENGWFHLDFSVRDSDRPWAITVNPQVVFPGLKAMKRIDLGLGSTSTSSEGSDNVVSVETDTSATPTVNPDIVSDLSELRSRESLLLWSTNYELLRPDVSTLAGSMAQHWDVVKKENGDIYLALWDHPDVIWDPNKRNEILISSLDTGEVTKEIYGMKFKISLDNEKNQISIEHIAWETLEGIASVYEDKQRKAKNLPTEGYFAAMPFASAKRSQDHPTQYKVTTGEWADKKSIVVTVDDSWPFKKVSTPDVTKHWADPTDFRLIDFNEAAAVALWMTHPDSKLESKADGTAKVQIILEAID